MFINVYFVQASIMSECWVLIQGIYTQFIHVCGDMEAGRCMDGPGN